MIDHLQLLNQKKREFVSRKEISLVYFRLLGLQGVNLDLRASPGKDLKRVHLISHVYNLIRAKKEIISRNLIL
jgi:hypothetical protein